MTNVKIYISGAQGPAGDSPTSIATTIHAAAPKTTPADLDELGIADSAASFGLKKLTWANLKTALSTALQSVFYTEAETNSLLNAKANLAGGNTFTGTQTINVGAFKDTTTTNTSSISATANTLTASRTVTLPDASGVMALTTNANGSTSDIELYAKAGLAINAAQVVYITGASGANVIIGLAQANSEATSSKTIGICKQNLANNGFGYVVTEGNLSGISVAANGAVEGDPVFLSPTIPGGMVFGLANKPSAPSHMVYLGVVKTVSGQNVTAIYVKVQNGFELGELHDVAISSPTNGQTIFRNGSNLWVNRAIVSADVSDATSAATANTVVKRGPEGQASFASGGFIAGAAVSATTTDIAVAVSATAALGPAINAVSASGTYHALFGSTGSDRSFIARVNGALGWFRGIYNGRIEAQASLTANQTYTLPDSTGTVVLDSTINAHLAAAPEASREVLRIAANAGQIENFSGLLAAFGEFMKLERSTRVAPLHVGITGFGDSMASGAYVNGIIYQQLAQTHGCGAWVSANLAGITNNGASWVFTGGASVPSSPVDFAFTPGGNWLVMPSGSTATTSIPSTTIAGLRGSGPAAAMHLHPAFDHQPLPYGVRKVSIYYVKQSGAGTIQATIQQSQYTDQVLSVSANAADGMGKLEFTPEDAYKPITVALAASVAQVRVIGVVFWGYGGVVAWSSQSGGSTMTQQLAALSGGAFKAAYSEFFAEMNTSLVLHQQRVPGDAGWQANYPTFFNALSQLNGSRVSQLVLGEPPLGTEGSPTTDVINTFLKAESAARGLAYIDQKAVLGSYSRLAELGFNITSLPSTVDSTHLGGLFYRFMAGFILNQVNNFQSALHSGVVDGFAKRDKTYSRFIAEPLEETLKRRLRFQTGFVPDGQLTSGTGYSVTVGNEKGVILSSGTVLGHAVCRVGVLSSGSTSGSRANLVAGTHYSITGKGTRNLNLSTGLKAWIVFGVFTTGFTSVGAITEKCYGIEFAWGADVGSPDGNTAEVARIFAYDGTALVYSKWNAFFSPGGTDATIGGLHFMLRWDPELKRLTLAASNGTDADLSPALRPICGLNVPGLTTSTNGAWANMGIRADDGANIPAAVGEFSLQELTCVGGQLGVPLRSFAS